MAENRTFIERLIDEMTGSGFPWVARVYFLLICFFGLTMVGMAIAMHHGGQPPLENDPYLRLFNLAEDGAKTVLGALIGSLSLAAEFLWKDRSK